ncbi:hypothetical protein Pelo_17483 [Pelomyxa schiedti]|nr:hypothetical protein Pelo_17483 [Pelomyxa schiedti]
MMKWDGTCCGDLLFIEDSGSTVFKPPSSRAQFQQSTVTATTQLTGTDADVYEWNLSITELRYCDYTYLVFYGLIPKPLDQDSATPASTMIGWSTQGQCINLPTGTPAFEATQGGCSLGGVEEVAFRHGNVTATVSCVPRGLYPTVVLWEHNTVKIS